MLTSRTIILFCLILLFAVATNILVDRDSDMESPPLMARNDPDIYMKNASITQYSDQGERHHKIVAERFTHFPLTNITTLKVPNVTLFSSQDNDPWDIEAEHGRLLPKVQIREQILELWDQVLAIQKDENGAIITIRTASLTVYPGEDYAETDQTVFIDNNNGRTTAAGMKAYFDEGRFVFFSDNSERVQTTLLPVF